MSTSRNNFHFRFTSASFLFFLWLSYAWFPVPVAAAFLGLESSSKELSWQERVQRYSWVWLIFGLVSCAVGSGIGICLSRHSRFENKPEAMWGTVRLFGFIDIVIGLGYAFAANYLLSNGKNHFRDEHFLGGLVQSVSGLWRLCICPCWPRPSLISWFFLFVPSLLAPFGGLFGIPCVFLAWRLLTYNKTGTGSGNNEPEVVGDGDQREDIRMRTLDQLMFLPLSVSLGSASVGSTASSSVFPASTTSATDAGY